MFLPKQLQRKEFNFIFLEGKNPMVNGDGWQKQIHPYTEAEEWLALGTNYGVMGGHGGLIIMDADSEAVVDAVEAGLPATFTVKTGSGKKHFYFICPEVDKKITLYDKTVPSQFLPGEDHYGEVITWGFQAVGPGSIHPDSHKYYEVYKDIEIAEISKDQLLTCLSPFLKPVFPDVLPPSRKTNVNSQFVDSNDDLIDSIQLTDIIKISRTGNIVHPIHGAKNGGNLNLNLEKNLWRCFRCESGGGPLSLLAVLEGIIDCSEGLPGSLRGEKFLKVKNLAMLKLGHSTPTAKTAPTGAPLVVPASKTDLILLSELSVPIFDNQWIWEGYISRSKITMLFATWKAGKTTFYTHLLRAIEQGKEFVGYKTEPTKILVISEEDPETWVKRRDFYKFGTTIYIEPQPFFSKPTPKEWADYLKKMAEYCESKDIALVVIDTIANLWPVDNENDASKVVEGLQPLREFTKRNVAVVALHHPKKEVSNIDTAMRGSGAFGAFCDAYMVLTRVNGNEKQRELNIRGRNGFSKEKIVIEIKDLDKATEDYIKIGTATEAADSNGKEIVMSVLRSTDRPLSIKEIREDCAVLVDEDEGGKKLSESQVYRIIGLMVESGDVEETIQEGVGRGKRCRLYLLTDKTLF